MSHLHQIKFRRPKKIFFQVENPKRISSVLQLQGYKQGPRREAGQSSNPVLFFLLGLYFSKHVQTHTSNLKACGMNHAEQGGGVMFFSRCTTASDIVIHIYHLFQN